MFVALNLTKKFWLFSEKENHKTFELDLYWIKQ